VPQPPSRTHHRTSRRPLLGLRARVTLTFALGALLLSAVLSVITFGLTRENVLNQREQTAVTTALRNATTAKSQVESLRAQLTPSPGPGSAQTGPCQALQPVLDGLPNPEGAWSLLYLRTSDSWCGTNTTRFESADVPPALRDVMAQGDAGRMRTDRSGTPMLVVGVPIDVIDADYFEGESMADLQTTLEGLGISLFGASVLTTIAGGLLGFWASRRVFRPMLDVGSAATAIAGGRLDTRLPIGNDPDLDRITEPFNDMAQALQERIERDARFASEVSHELRSPLMTLAASVEVIENHRTDLPDRARTALDLLTADVDRFQQLVEDLLEISRFDAGAIKLHLEEVAVAEMVIQAVSAVAGRAIPVRYDDDVADVIVRVDKRRFARVLANLIDNASKYADGPSGVTLERVGDAVRLGVEDRGPGIPEEEREVIFDRFSRGSESGKRATDSGVGLGLALVDEHVRLHGGRVWVEARPDGLDGARFVVELPIVDIVVTPPEPAADLEEEKEMEVPST
jgi:two-component system, OmpR family, sensor histidine kinase MtrB